MYDRKLVAYLQQQGVTVDLISMPWSSYGRHLLHNLSTAYTQQLNRPYDIIIQDELNHPSLFWLNRRLRRKLHPPIISIVHHLRCQEQWSGVKRPFYRHIERLYLNSVDGFIFNSHTTKETVAALRPTLPRHIIAYPAGDRFQPHISPETVTERANNEQLRLLFVGNLIARKGLHTLIDALTPLHCQDWQLDVVGNTAVSPHYTQQIRQQIKTAGLTSKITLHGTLPDAQLRALYKTNHLLVVPSQYEGFGIVYLEAMGFGLPAIATTSGAAHELITDGENGFLVDVGETAVLTQRIHQLMKNRDQLTRMSHHALTRFNTHLTWQQSMERIYHFLQTLA
ncbi:MAG: glycosyltransferase family 4 protein [Chloroflexi bacterium]|nr:glycosyltransferase family 4 protein [Chloroflexota bacterium]